jgi:hypothetical protein
VLVTFVEGSGDTLVYLSVNTHNVNHNNEE